MGWIEWSLTSPWCIVMASDETHWMLNTSGWILMGSNCLRLGSKGFYLDRLRGKVLSHRGSALHDIRWRDLYCNFLVRLPNVIIETYYILNLMEKTDQTICVLRPSTTFLLPLVIPTLELFQTSIRTKMETRRKYTRLPLPYSSLPLPKNSVVVGCW